MALKRTWGEEATRGDLVRDDRACFRVDVGLLRFKWLGHGGETGASVSLLLCAASGVSLLCVSFVAASKTGRMCWWTHVDPKAKQTVLNP